MTEQNRMFPPLVEAKITEMGFYVLDVIPLLHLWSVIAMKGEKRYNIQLKKEDLSIDSVHWLRYTYSPNGAVVFDVDRIRKTTW
jgi:hypothetical protein